LRLSQSSSDWARVVLAKRSQAPPITRDEALAVMETSPFNIRQSSAGLARLYQTATDPSPTRSGDFRRNADDISVEHAVDKPLHSEVPKTW